MTLILEEEAGSEPEFRLRQYQRVWADNVARDRAAGLTRLLIDGAGGTGKTSVFARLAKTEWQKIPPGRTLVLANRERLVGQTAQRIRAETGLEVDVEMADSHASPFAPIVVASVQTLGRINRLTGFADTHFSLVVPDEAHRSLSDQFQRVLRYFHYGAESLADTWAVPVDGTYTPKAVVVGTTATPDIGKKKNLGQFYQKMTARYSYLEAVQDGWLVAPVAKSLPLKVDLRKMKTGATANGTDFRADELSAQMIPIIEALADQLIEHASDRKTMCFLPSVECARMMDEALNRKGLRSIFVSGECIDADDKAEAFARAGPGTVMSLCSIYVEGIDFPDVNCIAWFRASISRAFTIQGFYRGTRTLPGLVNDDMTAAERRAAIAASAKPDLLILDPLWVTDRIDLCSVYDLFTDKPEVKDKMKQMSDVPMDEAAKKAERDFLAALEKEARKHAKKKARVIDPLAWAVSLGDAKLAAYKPEEKWEMDPPSAHQITLLQRMHMDTSKIGTKGLAQKVIGVLLMRMDLKLATPNQLDFLHKLGIDDEVAAKVTQREASILIDQRLNAKKARAQ